MWLIQRIFVGKRQSPQILRNFFSEIAIFRQSYKKEHAHTSKTGNCLVPAELSPTICKVDGTVSSLLSFSAWAACPFMAFRFPPDPFELNGAGVTC
jgi:hypothetical protein